MNRVNLPACAGCLVLGALLLHLASFHPGQPAQAQTAKPESLEAQVKKLQELVPDQAAVMSHLGYHYGNLWFALGQENWPLADFYLSETRANLKWAIRVKPVRKDQS